MIGSEDCDDLGLIPNCFSRKVRYWTPHQRVPVNLEWAEKIHVSSGHWVHLLRKYDINNGPWGSNWTCSRRPECCVPAQLLSIPPVYFKENPLQCDFMTSVSAEALIAQWPLIGQLHKLYLHHFNLAVKSAQHLLHSFLTCLHSHLPQPFWLFSSITSSYSKTNSSAYVWID